jgi:acyl-CoA thioesterase
MNSETHVLTHDFDAGTHAERLPDDPARPGAAYETTISDRWSALGGEPNGGYLLALCLRALGGEMPLPDPLVASAFFMRPAAPGPALLRTELIRAGRRSATGEVALTQDGREIVRTTATFGDLERASGRTLVLGGPPDLPPPERCVDPLGGASLPGVTIADRVEYRMAEMPGWTQGRPSGDPRAELWMRFKDGRDADAMALPLLVDAAAPAVMEIGEGGSSTHQLTVHVRGRPAPGWLACRISTRHVIGGYHEEDFEIWDSAARLVAQSRQLAVLKGSDRVGAPAG